MAPRPIERLSVSIADEFDLTKTHPLTDYPFIERSGLSLVHASRGRAVLLMPFEPNINHVNMMYAGALFTVAEVPGGVLFAGAFDLKRFYPIVGDMSIRFRKPAMTAVTVDARMSEGEIERVTEELEANGKAKWVIDAEVCDESGQVVATTSATYFGMSF